MYIHIICVCTYTSPAFSVRVRSMRSGGMVQALRVLAKRPEFHAGAVYHKCVWKQMCVRHVQSDLCLSKRDLYLYVKRPGKGTCCIITARTVRAVRHRCQKRPIYALKETCIRDMWNVHVYDKRPVKEIAVLQPIAFGVSFLHSYGITFIWDHIHIGSDSYGITFTWDLIHIDVQPIAFGVSFLNSQISINVLLL